MSFEPTTMMCGPVLIQLFSAVGLVAYGSELLASVPPSSMYITPTMFAGGGLCATQAWTHLPAFSSKHIGSGPGVSGASGMQVHPFLPLRSVVIAPLAPTVTTVASWAIAAGAADSALVTG